MPHRLGAKNFKPIADRSEVATTSTQEIRHLSAQVDATPLEQFGAMLRNQRSFLSWIDTRHQELVNAKRVLNPNGRGPKDAVYRKYRWYTEQQSLLEAINGFELFYKNTAIALARSIRRHVPPQRIKGSVDAKVLWASSGATSFTSLIFEHQLFHNLEAVDEMTNMLVEAKRYTPSNPKGILAVQGRIRALQCVFQIRHTLSHNQGRVTQSDSAKFAVLGFKAIHREILDPGKENLGGVVRDLLKKESHDFTLWLLAATARFLGSQEALPKATKDRIERFVGKHADLDRLAWQT